MLGEKLRLLRESRELSQKEISDYLQISRQAYSYYELGKREPSYDTLLKLSDFFKVSTDYLLGKTHSNEHTPKKTNPKVDVIAAHLDSDKLSDDDLDDIQQFIQFVQSRKE